MFWPLLRKCLRDATWLLVGCAVVMITFCWLRVWIVGQTATIRFKAILDLLPADWQRFTPVDLEWLITYPGRIAMGFDEIIVVILVTIWAIARGSDSVSGEISRGTMEMLLAQPLSRIRWLGTHALVTVSGVAVLAAAAWGGTGLGLQWSTATEEVIPTWQPPFPFSFFGVEIPLLSAEPEIRYVPMSERVDARLFVVAAFNLFSLGVMVAGVTTLMSSWDRYRWRTIGIVVGLYLVQLMTKFAALATERLEWLRYLTIFSAYEPELFVRVADQTPSATWNLWLYDAAGNWIDFGPLWYHLLLILVGVMCYALAFLIFQRRDLPAPL